MKTSLLIKFVVAATLVSTVGHAEDLRFMQSKTSKSDRTVTASDGITISTLRLTAALTKHFQAPVSKVHFSSRFFAAGRDDDYKLTFTVQKSQSHDVTCRFDYVSWLQDARAFRILGCESESANVEDFFLSRPEISVSKESVSDGASDRRVISAARTQATGLVTLKEGHVVDLARLERALQARLQAYVTNVQLDPQIPSKIIKMLKLDIPTHYFNVKFSVLRKGNEIPFECLGINNVKDFGRFEIIACMNDKFVAERFEIPASEVLDPSSPLGTESVDTKAQL